MGPTPAVPKPVMRIRELLLQKGITLDKIDDGIVECLSYKDKNSLGSCMRSTMSKEALQTYSEETHAGKREWLKQFLLDPAAASMMGTNTTINEDVQTNRNSTQWLTVEQLASPAYLNSMAHAELMVKDLPCQPHESASLAAQGVLVYKYTCKADIHDKTNKQQASVEATSELTSQEYGQVLKDMEATECGSAGGPATKRRKTTCQKRELSPGTKAKQSATTQRVNSLKKFKSEIDKSNSDIRQAEQMVKRMVDEKGFPETMQKWFADRVEEFKLQHAAHHEYYVSEMTKMPSTPWDVPALQSSIEAIEARSQNLATDFKQFKDGVYLDVKRLMGASGSK